MYKMFEVTNPVYQDYDDIWKQYEKNLIVLTNIDYDEQKQIKGGIVRYYGTAKNSLIEKWLELSHSEGYGECLYQVLFNDILYYPLGPGGTYL